MRSAARALLAATFVLAAPQVAAGSGTAILRDLLVMHRALATGGPDAAAQLRPKLAAIEQRIVALSPAERSSRRGVEAALILALSGGGVAVLRDLRPAPEAGVSVALVDAVGAALRNRGGKSAQALLDADLRVFSRPLAGHLALERARHGGGEPALELARSLSPGTLVEEVALRRLAALAARRNDIGRFGSLALRHLRRYPRSIYAGAFRQEIVQTIAAFAERADDEAFAKVEPLLAALPAELRAEVAGRLDRAGVLAARGRLARAAAPHLSAPPGPAAEPLSPLLAEIFDDASRARLEGIAPASLDPRGRALRLAALAMAKAARGWPPDAAKPPGDAVLPDIAGRAASALVTTDTLAGTSRP